MDDKFIEDIKKAKQRDFFKCGDCGCTWFEQRKFSRISDSHTVIFGQTIPPKSSEFIILICGKCNKQWEPRLLRMSTDSIDKEYEEFYKELNG